MEKVEAPECRPLHSRYDGTSANCVGVDAERNSDEVREEKSRCKSDRPGESSLCK